MCRPLSGAVSGPPAAHQRAKLCRFNCAAPFRGRLAAVLIVAIAVQAQGFNCAAPFRGRLAASSGGQFRRVKRLQLCRPLSGAVSSCGHFRSPAAGCFNCAAPFRGRLGELPGGVADRFPCFNCAAPFRGRLVRRRHPVHPGTARFNCAAPFRGRLGVCGGTKPGRCRQLQLCRPLSGAVRPNIAGPHHRGPVAGFNCAAPFRGRLAPTTPAKSRRWCGLQLCRPLSGAVSCGRLGRPPQVVNASIVPPPFGGG